MRLTEVHARYWARRKAPGWAVTMREREAARRIRRSLAGIPHGPASDVNECVNAHAGIELHKRSKRSLDTSNLLSLLALVRRNHASGAEPRDLVEYLSYLTVAPDSGGRHVIAWRLLRRWYRARHGMRI